MMVAQSFPLVVGTQVKQWLLERQLGRGASGEVWRAKDGTRIAAIKFMNENLLLSSASEKHLRRLEREIRILNQLRSPHIPELYESDMHYIRPYLAMQYVGDDSYDRLIGSGQMLRVPLQKRLQLLQKLADTLQLAHSMNIIHRDVKPSNVTGLNTPYLLDFSISLDEDDKDATMKDIGTAMYMDPDDSPPQFASDNYGFALVVYEVLFGTHAVFNLRDSVPGGHVFTRYQANDRIRRRQWRIPTQIPNSELPPDLYTANLPRLDEIFARGIHLDRKQRYTDLNQFVTEIAEAVNLSQIVASFTVSAPAVIPAPAEDQPTSLMDDNSAKAPVVKPNQVQTLPLVQSSPQTPQAPASSAATPYKTPSPASPSAPAPSIAPAPYKTPSPASPPAPAAQVRSYAHEKVVEPLADVPKAVPAAKPNVSPLPASHPNATVVTGEMPAIPVLPTVKTEDQYTVVEVEEERNKSKSRRRLLIIAGIVVLICVVLLILWWVFVRPMG
jgi:serine/threonine protein kinase